MNDPESPRPDHSPRDLLIGGLVAHDPSAHDHKARMSALSEALATEERSAMRLFARARPVLLTMAALLALAFLIPLRESSARPRWDELVREATRLEATATTQRWALTLEPPAQHAARPVLCGTLDVLDDTHFRVELITPDGTSATLARDGDRVTVSDGDRSTEHAVPPGKGFPAPQWLASRDGTLLVSSISRLLTSFDSRFAIVEGSPEGDPVLEAHPKWRRLDAAQVRADRADRAAPSTASVWFDADAAVQRIEVTWDDRGPPPPRGGRDALPPPPPHRPPPQPPGQVEGRPRLPGGAPSRMILERIVTPQ